MGNQDLDELFVCLGVFQGEVAHEVCPSNCVATFTERLCHHLFSTGCAFGKLEGFFVESVHLVIHLTFVSGMEGIVSNLLCRDAELCLVCHFGVFLRVVHRCLEGFECFVVPAAIAVELSCIDVVVAALCQVSDSVLDVNFISSFALRDLCILDFALQSICHVLQVGVEECCVEGFLVDGMLKHHVMREECHLHISLVCFAQLVFRDTATLECFADDGLTLFAFSHDFLFGSSLLVYLSCDGFVNLLSLCYLSFCFFLKGLEGCLIYLSHDGTDTEEQCHRKHNLFHVL